ncbi:MAG: hypothetical protein MJ072_01985, partial [Clostridia bacterium]|nr:hypothetical protein [Clostridia bacterium]
DNTLKFDDKIKKFSDQAEINFGWRKKTDWKDDELKDRAYYDVRGSVLTVDNIKEQKITPDMIEKMLSDVELESDNKELLEQKFIENKNKALNFIFGGGNPTGAFTCLLDQKSLEKGIYVFDENKAKEFKQKFSDEKMRILAEKVWRSAPPTHKLQGDLLETIFAPDCEKTDTVYDIFNKKPEKKPTGTALKNLVNDLVDLKARHEARSFWNMLAHPIDYYYEYKAIKQATDIFTTEYGVDPREIDPNAAAPQVEVEQEPGKEQVESLENDVVEEVGEKEKEIGEESLIKNEQTVEKN